MTREERHSVDLAALYVGGALTPAEEQTLERKLAAGDEELAHDLAELEVVARALADSTTPVEPRPETKSAVLERARRHEPGASQIWRDWESDAFAGALFTLAADEGAWEATGVEGIDVRRLFVDREHNRMTAMFRMAPGSAYVPHVHDQPEECFVLQGDLRVGDDLVMYAGDYQRAPAGSEHGVQSTKGGCLLLVSSSLHDEVV